MWQIAAHNISHSFNHRTVFQDISFDIRSGGSLAIIGPNGSGKTTLIRIVCRLLRPASGTVNFLKNNEEISQLEIYPIIGLVGPYLQLYNDLTAAENATFFSRIRGLPFDDDRFKSQMDRMGLAGREHEELRGYSSGMLQRAKYVCAMMNQPEILFLDEPTSNLDDRGRDSVFRIMEEQKKDKILVLATNNNDEVHFGDRQVVLGP